MTEKVSLHEMAVFCDARPEQLTQKQLEFVANMFDLTAEGEEISKAQESYLTGLYKRLKKMERGEDQ